jgi:hypothetical protein
MIARGSALRIQPPILTADTNKESASVAYATIVKSMARYPLDPLGPSLHPHRRILIGFHFVRQKHAPGYSFTAPVIADT